jgi:hypothetical protein
VSINVNQIVGCKSDFHGQSPFRSRKKEEGRRKKEEGRGKRGTMNVGGFSSTFSLVG